ncbi:mitochondrial protein [Coprinopsis marcescibilis]|uniref:Mitochondrial protein n=1 Tax=Coprinopsis marcescibilis TaxID=230819 RepID=A0A5C3LJK9_COPMA|nr:mitochondrial protein [Coprinopsis marcescibilis]
MVPAVIQSLLRKTPTLAPVANRALISVSGSDANVFLNGILTSQVKPPQFSAFLHAQGRVLYDVFIWTDPNPTSKKGPSYLIEYSPPLSSNEDLPPLLAYLKRHVLRSKVKVRDLSGEYDVWAAWGSEKDKIWETPRTWAWARSGSVEPTWDPSVEAGGSPWGTTPGVIHDRRGVGMGRRLLVRSGEKPQESSTHDIASSDDYLLHRMLHGVPEGNIDIPPLQAFPMDSSLDMMGAVDYRKGCYVGQELTVRTYHTGVVRKRIHPVIIYNPEVTSSVKPITLPTSLPPDLDIKPVQQMENDASGAKKGPRPRGTGKLLSTSVHGVGLALLRLEHAAAAQNGRMRLDLALPEDNLLSVAPWTPDWWPRRPIEDLQESR